MKIILSTICHIGRNVPFSTSHAFLCLSLPISSSLSLSHSHFLSLLIPFSLTLFHSTTSTLTFSLSFSLPLFLSLSLPSVWTDPFNHLSFVNRMVRSCRPRQSTSPRPPCDGTPSASVWPSPSQTPGSPCLYPSDRPPSGHRLGRREACNAHILQIGLRLAFIQADARLAMPCHGSSSNAL